MVNENQESEYHNNGTLNILIGVLIGGLIGAVTMLLLAPQSGEDTRMQIQDKGIELRDRTTGMMDDAMAQVRLNRDKITMGGRQKAKELLLQGRSLVADQLDNLSGTAQAGKKAVEGS